MSLHQQLLDATEPLMAGEHYSVARLAGPIAALRAVVELHAPVPCGWNTCRTPDTHRVCRACGRAVNHPCDELRTIARELGIEVTP